MICVSSTYNSESLNEFNLSYPIDAVQYGSAVWVWSEVVRLHTAAMNMYNVWWLPKSLWVLAKVSNISTGVCIPFYEKLSVPESRNIRFRLVLHVTQLIVVDEALALTPYLVYAAGKYQAGSFWLSLQNARNLGHPRRGYLHPAPHLHIARFVSATVCS